MGKNTLFKAGMSNFSVSMGTPQIVTNIEGLHYSHDWKHGVQVLKILKHIKLKMDFLFKKN